MESAAWNRVVNHSPHNGEYFAAAVRCSERLRGAVGSVERRLQVKGDAECVGFARCDVSSKVEQLRKSTAVCIEDSTQSMGTTGSRHGNGQIVGTG
jgi:hypothetical protein